MYLVRSSLSFLDLFTCVYCYCSCCVFRFCLIGSLILGESRRQRDTGKVCEKGKLYSVKYGSERVRKYRINNDSYQLRVSFTYTKMM